MLGDVNMDAIRKVGEDEVRRLVSQGYPEDRAVHVVGSAIAENLHLSGHLDSEGDVKMEDWYRSYVKFPLETPYDAAISRGLGQDPTVQTETHVDPPEEDFFVSTADTQTFKEAQKAVSPWLWVISLASFGMVMLNTRRIRKIYGSWRKAKATA